LAGGRHSQFFRPVLTQARLRQARSDEVAGTGPLPKVMMADGIGVVQLGQVRGYSEVIVRRYAAHGIQRILDLAGSAMTADGWIVDLRGDAGGDLRAHLGAIWPLIRSGPLMSEEDRDGHRRAYRATRMELALGDETLRAAEPVPVVTPEVTAGERDPLAVATEVVRAKPRRASCRRDRAPSWCDLAALPRCGPSA
jgi:hypothetical protein